MQNITHLASLLSIPSSLQPLLLPSLHLSSKRVELSLIDRYSIQNTAIDSYIVALGSNDKAALHLAIARQQIQQLASSYEWSTELVNPDYTASKDNPKPDYTNQCGLIMLKTPLSFKALTANSKEIEYYCKRNIQPPNQRLNRLDEPTSQRSGIVSIDIDIIIVRLAGQWRLIKQRYPLKAHERIGVTELFNDI